MGIFEPNMETMKRNEIERLQDKKLRYLVARAYQTIKMYHDKFKGLRPKDLRGLKDLERIPFTTKDDLRSYSLLERLAVPEIEILRYFSSSGTTGRPVVEGFTRKDMEVASTCCAKSFSCATITKEDKVLEPMPAAGLRGVVVAQAGLEKIGAKIIHTGPGRTKELQIPILLGRFEENMRPTAIIGYANYMLRIAEVARDMGIDPKSFGVKKLLCGGEMWSEGRRRVLEETYDAHAYDIFGLLEVSIGPGVAAECEEQNGLHIWENYFLVEIVDPQTGESLGLGEQGELVITTFEKYAHPLIRYRTGDVAKILSSDKCSCGRTNIRMGRIIGRTDDRFKVRGMQLYPGEVEEVLLRIRGVGSEYKVVLREINHMDDMLITVESQRGYSGAPNVLAQKISDTFKGVFNVTPRVEVVPYGTMKREERRKVQRIVDLRRK
jgi:phenylacetate-CoA ligase